MKAKFVQSFRGVFNNGLKIAAVFLISKIGLYVCNNVICSVNRHVTKINQVPRLARLYSNACIRIGRTVMGMIAQITSPGIIRSEPVVCIRMFLPVFLAPVYFIQFKFLSLHRILITLATIIGCLSNRLLIKTKTLVNIFSRITWSLLYFQTIQGSISLYKSSIDGLRMSCHHSLFNAHFKNLIEEFFKEVFAKKLPGAAYSAMPGQRFVNIIIKEIENIHPHAAKID